MMFAVGGSGGTGDDCPSTVPIDAWSPIVDAPAHAETPELVGRYEILGELGAGGMGVIFHARDPVLGRNVAIKVLKVRGSAAARREMVSRTQREARALASLSHPNVVAVYDVGEHDGGVFIAMELVRGDDVKQWMLGGERSWREVVDVFAQAGRGLHALHRHGLLHRDVKPSNMIVGEDGRVRVLDLGLVRAAEGRSVPSDRGRVATPSNNESSPHDGETLTQTGLTYGTPAYMAPEQRAGEALDERADQFSFCVALYEALHSERPFDVVDGDVVWRPRTDGTVPRSVGKVLDRGLSVPVAERFESMQALLVALEAARESRRPRTVMALGAAALTVVAVGVAVRTPQSEAAPCSELEAPPWNTERQAELAAAMGQSEEGTATWQQLQPRLAGYADELAAARLSACRAATVDEATPYDLYARQRDCFSTRQHAFVARLDVLADLDDASIDRAATTVDRLPSIEQCTDLEEMHYWVAAPDADEAAAVANVRSIIERVRAVADLGLFEDAMGIADSALPLLDGIEYLPVHAELAAYRGHLQDRISKGLDAEETLQEALRLCQASDYDSLAARVLMDLAGVLETQERFDAAQTHLRHAEAAIERMGNPRHLRATFTHRMGRLEMARSRFAEALPYLEEALQLRRAATRGSELNVVVTLDAIGAALLRMGREEEATARFEEALAIKLETFGEIHPEIANSRSNLGTVLSLQGRPKEALPHLQAALKIVETTKGHDHENVGAILLNIGAAQLELQDWEAALASSRRGVEVLEARLGEGHSWVQSARTNLVMASTELGLFEEAEAQLRVLERAPPLPADHPNFGSVEQLRADFEELRDAAAARPEAG